MKMSLPQASVCPRDQMFEKKARFGEETAPRF